MAKFRIGTGGRWLVTQVLGEHEVVNSCKTYEDAEDRASFLVGQEPAQEVTLYKAIERFSIERTPVKKTPVEHGVLGKERSNAV